MVFDRFGKFNKATTKKEVNGMLSVNLCRRTRCKGNLIKGSYNLKEVALDLHVLLKIFIIKSIKLVVEETVMQFLNI